MGYTRVGTHWCLATGLNSQLLDVDYTYQRPTENGHVMNLVNNWNPMALDPLDVSDRDGRYYVVDGAHRLAAMRIIHGTDDFPVRVNLYYGLTYEEEAAMFATQSGINKPVPAGYRLRAWEMAQDRDTMDFLDRTRRAGFEIVMGASVSRDGVVGAVKTANDCYKTLGADKYEEMMKLIHDTWGGSAWSVRQEMLTGMRTFMKIYGSDYRRERFINRLESIERKYISREACSHYGDTKPMAWCKAIVTFYNKKGGATALDKSKTDK